MCPNGMGVRGILGYHVISEMDNNNLILSSKTLMLIKVYYRENLTQDHHTKIGRGSTT